VADFACALFNHVSVPLAVANSDEHLRYILDHAEVACLVVSRSECAARLLEILKASNTVKWIVYLEDGILESEIDEEENVQIENSAASSGIIELSYRELLKKGKSRMITPQDAENESDMVTLLYTSGSTNRPKGTFWSSPS
jgi:long-subunit acyl-CoA synthetase (AMP-forming)